MTTTEPPERSTRSLARSPYVEAALDGELAKLGSPHKDKNSTLYEVATRLYEFVEADALSDEYVSDRLTNAALKIKLTRQEIKDTLKSAQRRAGANSSAVDHIRSVMSEQGRWDGATPAREPLPPDEVDEPCAAWQMAAQAFVIRCQDCLWVGDYPAPLDYLEDERKLNALTTQRLGYNPTGLERSRARWGLPEDKEMGDRLWLWPGLVFAYIVDRVIYKLEIRPLGKGQRPKTVPGSANVPWGLNRVTSRKPVMLVEGVLNALTVTQEAGDLVTPVAIGSATACRRIRWIAALSRAPRVLIATDAGKAGEEAASYWLDVLRHTGRRWRPYTDDANKMLQSGMDVRAWVKAGLEAAQ